jgi:hypothetical protein
MVRTAVGVPNASCTGVAAIAGGIRPFHSRVDIGKDSSDASLERIARINRLETIVDQWIQDIPRGRGESAQNLLALNYALRHRSTA